MNDEKKKNLIEELKLMSDDYRYRDQLMVTEFGLSMTAIAFATSAALRTESWELQATIVGLAFIFSMLIANHMTRINVDRLSAGERRKNLLKTLGMHQPHMGFERKQAKGTFPAPISFVVFSWLLTAVLFFSTGYLVICRTPLPTTAPNNALQATPQSGAPELHR